ncbi:hypothetical protein PGB90_001346 [Kerria lacca]
MLHSTNFFTIVENLINITRQNLFYFILKHFSSLLPAPTDMYTYQNTSSIFIRSVLKNEI